MEFSINITVIFLIVITILVFAVLFHIFLTGIFAGAYREKLDNYINKFNTHLKRKAHDLINEHDIDPGLAKQIIVDRDNGFNNVLNKSETEFESYDQIKYDYLSKTVGALTYNQILDDKYGSDNEECIRKKSFALTQKSENSKDGSYCWMIVFILTIMIPLL